LIADDKSAVLTLRLYL